MKKVDVYKLRSLFEAIENNAQQDVNNPTQASKRAKLAKEGVAICNEYINKLKPL